MDTITNLIVGSLSGTLAVTLCYPSDLIRKNMHVNLFN